MKAAVAAITALCGLDKHRASLPYDDRAVASFLGKGGARVKALSAELGVEIALNRSKKCVVLRGEEAAVEAAKPVVARALKECIRVEDTVQIPTARLSYLLGRRIRALQAGLNVLIDVPKQDEVHTARAPISLRGQEDLVAKAKQVFEAIGKGALPLRARVFVCVCHCAVWPKHSVRVRCWCPVQATLLRCCTCCRTTLLSSLGAAGGPLTVPASLRAPSSTCSFPTTASLSLRPSRPS